MASSAFTRVRTMKPRITVNVTPLGEFQIWINAEGRDLLVRELQRLDTVHAHFHLMPEGCDAEVEVSSLPYIDTDKVFECGRVIFRTDEWDRQYFPHVLGPNSN
jgi:hypothetical protein